MEELSIHETVPGHRRGSNQTLLKSEKYLAHQYLDQVTCSSCYPAINA